MIQKALFLLFTLLVSFSLTVAAQSTNDINTRSTWQDRVFISPNLSGFDFSNVRDAIGFNLSAGYRFTNKFSSGVGLMYWYTNYKISKIKTHNIGQELFSRFNITDEYFLRVSYETHRLKIAESSTNSFTRNFEALMVGGGYSSPLGGRSFLNVSLYYNLLHDNTDIFYPYGSALVPRIGVSFGL